MILRKPAIKILLAGLGMLINRIPYEPLKNWYRAMYDPIFEIADVMTDKDPDNAEQMQEIWEEYGEVITNRTAFTLQQVAQSRIKDPATLEFILSTIDLVKDTINDPDDNVPLLIQMPAAGESEAAAAA